jgi:hypothetical protein
MFAVASGATALGSVALRRMPMGTLAFMPWPTAAANIAFFVVKPHFITQVNGSIRRYRARFCTLRLMVEARLDRT